MVSTYTTSGIELIINRGYTDSSITKPDKFKVGQNQTSVSSSDTDLIQPIPISNGTVNDNGDNTLTGSSGGSNSTDNIVRFKQGAGQTDNTAQNLISNGTNVNKVWTISDLSSLGINIISTQPFGLWLYISDQTTLDYFVTSALEIKLGSDSSNYHLLTKESSDLSIGWNWIFSTVNVEDLSTVGTPTGNIDTFIIEINTNNASDSWASGDVVYDLLRQWADTDLVKAINASYPVINNVAQTVLIRGEISSVEANGFNISGHGIFNTDSPRLMEGIDNFVEESKNDSDEFIFSTKNKFQISNAV